MEVQVTADAEPTFRSYLSFTLSSPIAVWWAVATGVIELVSFGLVAEVFVLSKWWLLILILVVSFSVMIALLVLWRGWPLYSKTFERVSVSEIVRIEGKQVFLLGGIRHFRRGSIFEVYRTLEDVDVSIGFVRTMHQREDGRVQAEPVWIRPGHLRDIETGALSKGNLRAYQTVSGDTLKRWIDDEAEARVQSLIRRGAEG